MRGRPPSRQVHASTRKRLKNSTDHPIFGEWEARFAAQPNVRLGVRAQEALTLISIKMDGSSDMSGEGQNRKSPRIRMRSALLRKQDIGSRL